MRSPRSLLFSCVNKFTSPVLKPLNHLGSPPLDLLQYVTVFLERKVISDPFSWPTGCALLIQPSILPASFTARVQCWLFLNFVHTKIQGSFGLFWRWVQYLLFWVIGDLPWCPAPFKDDRGCPCKDFTQLFQHPWTQSVVSYGFLWVKSLQWILTWSLPTSGSSPLWTLLQSSEAWVILLVKMEAKKALCQLYMCSQSLNHTPHRATVPNFLCSLYYDLLFAPLRILNSTSQSLLLWLAWPFIITIITPPTSYSMLLNIRSTCASPPVAHSITRVKKYPWHSPESPVCITLCCPSCEQGGWSPHRNQVCYTDFLKLFKEEFTHFLTLSKNSCG